MTIISIIFFYTYIIIMNACKKSIRGYQVSDTRATCPCILAMRMAFDKFKNFPGKVLISLPMVIAFTR